MEENNRPQSQPQASVPVMDIQPPKVAPVPDQPAQTPVAEQPVGPPEAIPSATDVPQGAENNPAGIPVLAAQQTEHKSHRAPIVAIICAVVIAGVFATVAVLAYMSNPNAGTNGDTSQQPASSTVQEDTATATDVTETEKAIDDSLSGVDDAADYNDAEVSDTTLGL